MSWNRTPRTAGAGLAPDGNGAIAPSVRLAEARDVAEDPRLDVRGFHVYSSDGKLVGAVDALLVDAATPRLRYLGIALTDPQYGVVTGRVMVPIGAARQPADRRIVTLFGIAAAQLACAPRLRNWRATRAEEDATLAAYGMATSRDVPSGTLYDSPHFDEQRLVGDHPAHAAR